MIVEHQADGRTLMDREALALATGRSVATIRARCAPVAVRLPPRGFRRRGVHSGRVPLYDAAEVAAVLASVPARRRV